MDITEPEKTGLLDNPFSAEVFSIGAAGFLVVNGNIAITFEDVRSDYSTNPPGVNRVVVGRLVLPISGAQNLVAGLNAFLEQHGIGPSDAIAGGATRQ